MPQSLSRILIHTIFSTKNRESVFTESAFRHEMHAFVGGVAKTLKCFPIEIGGTADHIHILSTLDRSVCVADFVKESGGRRVGFKSKTVVLLDSIGRQDTACFPFQSRIVMWLPITLRIRRSITAKQHFRMSIECFARGMSLELMSNMCGIEVRGCKDGGGSTQPRWGC